MKKPLDACFPVQLLCIILVISLAGCTDHPATSVQTSTLATTKPASHATDTPIPSPKMTETPQATLSTSEVQSVILELLETNAGCKLPCWWGITPGETTIQEALMLLDPIADNVDVVESLGIGALVMAPGEGLQDKYIHLSFMTPTDVIQRIRISEIAGSTAYHIPKLLRLYGQPDEIWVHTYSSYPEDQPWFWIDLFYPEQGIHANYFTQEGEFIGDNVRGCFNSNANLYLWEPKKILTTEEILTMFEISFIKPTLRLIDATHMSEEDFYITFKDSNDPICLETPRDLWLGAYGEPYSP